MTILRPIREKDTNQESSNMKLNPQATKGHLIVGALLILLSLSSMIASLFVVSRLLVILIFFFGVWGGIETGRYLEYWIGTKNATISNNI